MASEHEKLVEEAIKAACVVASREELRRHGNGLTMSPFDRTGGTPEEPLFRWQRHIAEQRPIVCAVIAEIAKRTKEATDAMRHELLRANRREPETHRLFKTAYEYAAADLAWRAMHDASALWPSHKTDGIEEKAK